MSGAVGSVVGNGTVPSIAWIPWVSWAADRLAQSGEGLASYESRRAQMRDALVFAALLAPELVRGEPAGILTSVLVAFAVTIARAPRRVRALGRLSLAAAAGSIPLAAATVLPALYLLPFSDRAEGSGAIGLAWSMHPTRMLEWVWPSMFGHPAWPARNVSALISNTNVVPRGATNWSASIFFGAPALWLATRARGRGARTLLVATIAFVVLALGRFTPIYPALREISFPLQLVRFPEKFLIGAACIWSALAGAGLGATFSGRPAARAVVGATAIAIALTLLVTAGTFAAPYLVDHLASIAAAAQPPIDVDAALTISIREGAIAAAVAAVFAMIVAWRRFGSTALPASLAVVCLLTAPSCGTPSRIRPRHPAESLSVARLCWKG